MTSVTISNGVPAAANVTSGDTKWTGTIVNDFNHSHGISIKASSGTNKLTLAHGTKYELTAGGQSFIFTTPSDSDTHYTARLYVGVKDQASTSAASTNGTVYLKLVENGTIRDQHKIAGSGATTVTSNASGDITITTPTKAADADKLDGQDSSYYLDYNHLKNRPPAYKYTYQNGYLVVQAL